MSAVVVFGTAFLSVGIDFADFFVLFSALVSALFLVALDADADDATAVFLALFDLFVIFCLLSVAFSPFLSDTNTLITSGEGFARMVLFSISGAVVFTFE